MKKLILAFALCLSFLNLNAQDSETQGRNDIIADPIMLIAVPAANLTYERLLNANSGAGVNVIIGLGRDTSGFMQISPFYRMYFGKKFAQGFFLEGFVPITSFEEDQEVYVPSEWGGYYTSTGETVKRTAVGAGFGFGGKWVVRKNFVVEASGGLARLFGNDTNHDFFAAVTGKIMAGIGYRF